MIPLATNAVSEPLRRVQEPRIADWINTRALETLQLPAITFAEMRSESDHCRPDAGDG